MAATPPDTDSNTPPLQISMAITFDGVLLCPENTPNLFDTLKQMMEASNIWTRLCFRRTVFSGSRDSNTTFGINLHDELFDVATINDLLLSSSEQVSLNSLCTAVVRAVDIDVHVHNTGGFKEAWILGNSIKDLNFIFFQCFLKLEEHLPLLFNYISRSTYLATKDVIQPIVASCLKSNETYMIEQRSVLAGIINSLCRCPTWIEAVHLWDHSKLKREFPKEDGFSITWFYPFYDETCNHASL